MPLSLTGCHPAPSRRAAPAHTRARLELTALEDRLPPGNLLSAVGGLALADLAGSALAADPRPGDELNDPLASPSTDDGNPLPPISFSIDAFAELSEDRFTTIGTGAGESTANPAEGSGSSANSGAAAPAPESLLDDALLDTLLAFDPEDFLANTGNGAVPTGGVPSAGFGVKVGEAGHAGDTGTAPPNLPTPRPRASIVPLSADSEKADSSGVGQVLALGGSGGSGGAEVTIDATDATAAEAGSDPGTFTVTRTGDTSAALTVNFAVSGGGSGSATLGDDYNLAPSSGSVTIAAGSATATITVTPVDDALTEGNETVRVVLTPGTGYTVGTPSNDVVTILDNDSGGSGGSGGAMVAIDATDATAAEAGTDPGTFTVTRSGDTASALTVFYAVSGSATSGSDYTALSGSATIAAGQSSATITVTPLDDSTVEPTELVIVTLASGTGYTIGNPSSATVTILDDEPPQVTISATDAQATEPGTDTGTFTVSRAGDLSQALTVNFTVAGSATTGNDYQSLSSSVTIAAGQSSATITVTPLNDTTTEPIETVIATLASGTGYTIGNPSSATVNLFDDEPPVVTISATDAQATEPGIDPDTDTGTFTISRIGDLSQALTVNFSVGGSATADSDYQALGGSVTIAADQSSATITVTPLDDTTAEPTETVAVTLTSDTGYTVGGPSQATINITDNDTTVTISATDSQAKEPGTDTGIFTVSRSGDTSETLIVSYSVSGTATSGSDYTALSGSVTIDVGQSGAPITVTPLDDSTAEPTETVVVTLERSTSYTVGDPGSATVNLLDDEQPVVTISATDAQATEPGTDTGTFTVSRAGDLSQALTVNFSVAGSAAAGSDYQSLNSSITIAVGQSNAAITVTPLDDTTIEPTETVAVTLASGAGYTVGDPSQATVNLIDNDDTSQVPVANDDSYTTEWETPVSANVGANDSGVNLTYTLLTGAVNGNLSFSSDGSFIYTDFENYSDGDTFTYQVTDEFGNTDAATVTINAPPLAQGDSFSTFRNQSLTVGDFGVLANDVTPDQDSLTAQLVSPASSGTAALNTDGSFTYTPDLGFAGADSFSYQASDGLAISEATVTITVNAGAFQFSQDTYTTQEGPSIALFTVERTGEPIGSASVEYFTGTGDASGASDGTGDYSPVSGLLAFADGESSKTFAVFIRDDQLVEFDEFFTVQLANPGPGYVLDESLQVAGLLLVDNDGGEQQPQPLKPFGGALQQAQAQGNIVIPNEYTVLDDKTGKTFKVKVQERLGKLKARLQKLDVNVTGVLTGDIFDPSVFEYFNNLQATENKILITINGINNTRQDALALLDSVKTFNVGNRKVAVVNGTHGLGDYWQIAFNELGKTTIADLRAVDQIEIAAQALRNSGAQNPTIYVVAHSQGTEIFFRALNYLKPQTIQMIEFYGNGGERWVPNDLGLKKAVNYYRQNDGVAFYSNRNGFRWWYAQNHNYEVWNVGKGGVGLPPGLNFLTAHTWKDNYDVLYDTPGGVVDLPQGAKVIKYPLFRLP